MKAFAAILQIETPVVNGRIPPFYPKPLKFRADLKGENKE